MAQFNVGETKEYWGWLMDNPGGYVIDLGANGAGRLHKATCGTISEPNGNCNVNGKCCEETYPAIQQANHEGRQGCGICNPP